MLLRDIGRRREAVLRAFKGAFSIYWQLKSGKSSLS
jgi:hypothetical protein